MSFLPSHLTSGQPEVWIIENKWVVLVSIKVVLLFYKQI